MLLRCRAIAAVGAPPIALAQSPAWTAKKALHGRHPFFAAVRASEQWERGFCQRHTYFVQLLGGEASWSGLHLSSPLYILLRTVESSCSPDGWRAYPADVPRTRQKNSDTGVSASLTRPGFPGRPGPAARADASRQHLSSARRHHGRLHHRAQWCTSDDTPHTARGEATGTWANASGYR